MIYHSYYMFMFVFSDNRNSIANPNLSSTNNIKCWVTIPFVWHKDMSILRYVSVEYVLFIIISISSADTQLSHFFTVYYSVFCAHLFFV